MEARERGQEDHLVQEGEFDGTSMARNTFKPPTFDCVRNQFERAGETRKDPGPTQRSKKSVVEDNLRPEGDFDSVTNNREQFQPHQTFDRNQRAQNQRKETVSNPPYQVQPELMSAGGRSQNTSEAKENFRPISNPGPRQKPSITKNESHIYNDGSFDAQTLNRENFRPISNPAPREKPSITKNESRIWNEGQFDSVTLNRSQFRPISNHGPRQKPSITKNESHIYNDGSFDAQTLNRENFRPISNPGPRQKPSITKNESTIWNEGSFDSVTLNRQSYQGQYGHEKQGKLKAEDKIKLEGDMDSRPLNRLDYPEHVVIKPQRSFQHKNSGHLTYEGLNFDGGSENGQYFTEIQQQGRRTAPIRQKSSQTFRAERVASLADFRSQTNFDYQVAFDVQRPNKVRMGDHLQPGGGIEVPRSADVRGKMVALGGATPSDLRAKPSWFHDILTPYDAVALGHARSLGNLVAVGGPGQ